MDERINSLGLNPAGHDRVWLHRTCWLLLALAVFRIAYTWLVPLDLVHDEAYYWDWSRQLAWGYYSKPPMVAWLIALSTSLGGSSTFFVRLPAILLGTVGLAWMYLLAASLYGRRAGFWAVCLTAATPGNAAVGLLMTIDAPFLFCWGAALFSFWRLLQADCRRTWWLLAAVLSVGLGLLSKQTMLGFLVLGGFFIVTSRDDRRELLKPAVWLWVAGSLAFLTPVLWWNSQHGWITAQHTSQHFTGASVSVLKRLARCGEFVGSQFGVLSPLTCFLVLAVSVVALRSFLRLGRRERFLLCFSGLPLAGVFVLSALQRVEPNWPASFYLSGIVLLVGVAQGHVGLAAPSRLREKSLLPAVGVGAIAAALTYLLPFGFGLQGTKLDPAVRLRGWSDLGFEVGTRFSSLPRPARTLLVVTTDRAVASELAFYMPQQPRVYLWKPGDEILSQYDVWQGPTDRLGWDALIVTEANSGTPAELRAAFAHVEDRGEVEVPVGNGRRHTYHLWRGEALRGWPQPPRLVARTAPPPTRR